MTKYGRSPWIESSSRNRACRRSRVSAALTRATSSIIGGGLTGCATAYAFAVAGVKVVLLEAAQIGRGNSGSSGGWISDDPGIAFADLEKALGLRGARRAWQGVAAGRARFRRPAPPARREVPISRRGPQ